MTAALTGSPEAPPGSSRHLLTVLHSGERTGPPILALRFLRWLAAERPGWALSTLFLADGPMATEFRELGPVVVAAGHASAGSVRRRAVRRARESLLRRRIARLGPVDLVHVHCAGSMWAVELVPTAPVVCHLHELDVGLDLHVRPRAAARVADADAYVTVSDGVSAAFSRRWDVDPARVHRQWGFVDQSELPGEVSREQLGLGSDEIVVVGAGVRHWRKGPELFVRSAQSAAELAPDLPWRFVWVGGERSRGAPDVVDLVDAAGLSDLVTFLEHRHDALDWLSAADIFVSTAREDAFPLVCVEAAAVGTPIVTFDSGGAADLVRAAHCGEVIDFPRVDDVAASLVAWASDAQRRSVAGEAGRRFAALHLATETAAPELLSVLEGSMGTS